MLPEAWTYRRVADYPHPTDQTVQTGPFGAQLHADDYVDEGVPFVLIRNIKNGRVDPTGMPKITLADAARLDNYALQEGDIVFSRVGRVGSCFLTEADHVGWIISGQLLRMRLDMAELDPRFLIHWIASPYVEHHILGESVGTTRQSINSSILASMPIPAIPKAEQSKIAEILDTLDTAIRQTEAIIKKLKQVKQGLLHDLLTRGIDANGELRPPQSQAPHLYKDSPLGWIPREWNASSIDAACSDIVDCPHSTPNFLDDGVLVARTMHIKAGVFLERDASRVSEAEYRERIARIRPEPGDVVFTREAPVGEAFVIPAGMRICLGQRVMLLRPRPEMAFGQFLLAQIYSGALADRISALTAGTTNPHLNVAEVRQFVLPLPPVQEQALIEQKLGGLDCRIAVEGTERDKLLTVKSGLMDDLLTGRVRVTSVLADDHTM